MSGVFILLPLLHLVNIHCPLSYVRIPPSTTSGVVHHGNTYLARPLALIRNFRPQNARVIEQSLQEEGNSFFQVMSTPAEIQVVIFVHFWLQCLCAQTQLKLRDQESNKGPDIFSIIQSIFPATCLIGFPENCFSLFLAKPHLIYMRH